ncbi:phosphotransferase [candidate division KSB1 bacterium]|nr:phosphotransferase [candidate division KSB1 bacterium]
MSEKKIAKSGAADEYSEFSRILAHYNLSPPSECKLVAGGTRNRNYMLLVDSQKYFLRCRNQAFCNIQSIRFDHELMRHLRSKGILAPCPILTASGESWLDLDDQIYELFTYIEAKGVYHQHDTDQLKNAGKALGQFHQAVFDFQPGVEKSKFRIDPPEKAAARIKELVSRSDDPNAGKLGDYIMKQIDRVKQQLPDALFFELPSLIVHGDYHPANVKYNGKQVAGFFDLDWASRQPRIYDLSYGLLYFVALRENDIDGSDIYSLTQTCKPDIHRSSLFVSSYLNYIDLQPFEIDLLPIMMRINWICCRTDGSHKVPPEDQWRFFSIDIKQPLRWLDKNETNFTQTLKDLL